MPCIEVSNNLVSSVKQRYCKHLLRAVHASVMADSGFDRLGTFLNEVDSPGVVAREL